MTGRAGRRKSPTGTAFAPPRPRVTVHPIGGRPVARKVSANGFDPDRGLWTAAGCVAAVLLWALIVAACGHLIRG
jgi:hypothetical protein